VEEKYKICDETLSKLLQWISEIENKLANQDTVKEDVEELRKQIFTMKVSAMKFIIIFICKYIKNI
jgi:RAB protein geranylgeranyltransferase component A